MLRGLVRLARLVAPFLIAVGVLYWIALSAFSAVHARWIERDSQLRARLALAAAHDQIVDRWEDQDRPALQRLLDRVVRDERIGGLALCDSNGSPVVQTECFPALLTCDGVAPLLGGRGQDWSGPVALLSGTVHVTAIPVEGDDATLGFAVVVHDLRFAARRKLKIERGLQIFFAILALVGVIATVAGYRFSWRTWTVDLRRILVGDGDRPHPAFQPLMRDVQDLVARLASEAADSSGRGAFTPERLRQTLRQQLHGDRVIAVSHREPFVHERAADGSVSLRHPPSGLVTALEPVMRACSGVWIAHGSGSADMETADRRGRIAGPPGETAYTLRRLRISEFEEKGFYFGFSNEGLWPLCHLAHTRPVFRAWDWEQYRRVNQRFADAVVEEADGPDPIVLLQDYQFALAPQMIRKRLPGAHILTFWHIPWPNAERIAICPWHLELLEGLLGSTIVGFQTQLNCNNFVETVDRYLEARIDRERQAISLRGETTLIRPYPISIEWPPRALRSAPPVEECRASVHAELGVPAHVRIGLAVDRMDYTKGIEDRLQAVERLLEVRPDWRGRFTFVQLAPPSRTAIARYREVERDVAALTERINGRFGKGEWQPVVLRRAHHEPEEVFRYYRAADFCHVGSLADGMNLVAKEFVAAHDDGRGVLILSSFTGAARELTEALIVNPYDVGQSAEAMIAALEMPAEEQQARLAAMRNFVSEFNVYRWAERMLVDGARARRSFRLRERLRQAAGAES
ncbi:MAG: alpha,alpha-trehalose-phosphate synthase (UDP-forming) [Myxococcales bacterium]